uniref:Putative transcription regulator xnp/atrx dead-box superfamily protein n=1 Tax=Anopheles triannulatus TaxID=58253 RepID=A0A2M4A4Z9_9DIPT
MDIKMELVDQCDAGEEEIAVAIESEALSTSVAPLTIDTAVVIDDDSIKDGPRSDGTASIASIASTSGTGDVAVVVLAAAGAASTGELVVEKDTSSSLSPELVSEGVSELSVKECYGEPAFLENNLGIEKDPKLGEIVQERFRCDKVSGEDVNADASAVVACVELVKVKEEAKEEQEEKDQVPSAAATSGGGGDSGNGDRDHVADIDGGGSVGDKQQVTAINGKAIESEKVKEADEDQDVVMVVKEELEQEKEATEVTEVREDTSQNDEPMIVDQPVVCEKADQSDKPDKSECSVSLVEEQKQPIDEEMPEVITVEDKESEMNGATVESAVAVTIEESDTQAEEQSTSLPVLSSVELPTDVVIIDDAEEDEDGPVKELPPANADCKDSASEMVKSSDSLPNVVDTSSIESTDKRASVSPSTVEGAKINGESGESDATDSDKQSSNQQLQVAAQKQSPPPKQSSPASLGGSRATTPKPGKSSSSSAGGNSKESKTKTRTTKEKTKEDEKTREEKLRQEKLRVEEKVREEKLRAERLLQQEAEQRLKEGLQKKTKEVPKGAVENGVEEEEPASHASNPPSPKQSDETDKKTESATAAESAVKMISIGSLSLPAITLLKKDNGVTAATSDTSSSSDSSAATVVEAELVSGKTNRSRSSSRSSPSFFGRTSKEEKPPNKQQAESPVPIATKSETAGTATARDTSSGSSNKLEASTDPSLSMVKIEKNEEGDDEQQRKDELKLKDVVLPLVLLEESDDAAKLKESHLKHLGLLTLQAASEEKQRLADLKPATPLTAGDMMREEAAAAGAGGSGEGWLADPISKSTSGAATGSNSSTAGGRGGNKSTRSSKDEYTVSMKTVQQKGGTGSGRGGEKRKQQRMPLKMTFQKGKGKGSGRDSSSNGSSGVSSNGGGAGGGTGSSASGYATDSGTNNGGDYYTIHSNEADHHSSNSSDGHGHRESGGAGGRKTHSRSHTTDGVNLAEAIGEPPSTKEVIQKALVIPEKASSFKVHPDRLCQDQCFYCGGKFGLYDTPCHIAAIKSADRQQKILLAESKITLDSCLCDACFRHVDRKANCPSQKKKVTSTVTSNEGTSSASTVTTATTTKTTQQQSTVTPIVIKMTTNKDGSTSITGQQQQQQPGAASEPTHHGVNKVREICAVRHCTANAMQSLRRRWVMKMKRKIGKHLDINFEHMPKQGNADYVSICNKHYEQIDHLMICAMCTRQLQRNQVYHMFNNIPQLERLIQEQGIPGVRLSSSELVVCKICRYYANLLLKPPPDVNPQKSQFIANYNRRLYNARHRNNEPEEVMIQAVDPASVVSCRQSSSTADIVISDGDEEEAGEEGEEEEEEEVYPNASTLSLQQQQQQQQQSFQAVSELFSIGDNSVSLRRRANLRKSPEVSIVENNGAVVAAAMGDLGEISILPATKSFTATTAQQQQQQVREDDNIDMTKVLKSNPNISMRELFPGEEDLGIHVNIPFSSATMRTPEGWTKVTTTVQYDDSTRALWEELQEPYGNQSSFLRHLLLLERYFRNGELVLSPLAKTNATSYAEAMQSRLRSYDNKPSAPSSPPALASLSPSTSAHVLPTGAGQLEKASNILQQFSNSTITIVPTTRVRGGTKAATVPGQSANSAGLTVTPQQQHQHLLSEAASPPALTPAAPVSLLKSNNLHLANNSHQQDQTMGSNLKRKISVDGGTKASLVPVASSSPHASAGASKVAKLDDPKGTAASSMPPELICLNRKPSVTITTIPPTRPAPANQPQQQQSLLQQQQSSTLSLQQEQQQQTVNQSPTDKVVATATGPANREIIHMPDKLTEAERRESSRTWRPTLLAIVPGVTESLKTEPLYKTADGRLLPRLVQVMSGGKQYHISINDYNRMCILRREKLIQQQLLSGNKRVPPGVGPQQQQQQLQQQTTPNKGSHSSSPVASSPPSVSPAAVATGNTIPNLRLSVSSDGSFTGGPKMVQIPNQILEQNSLIPLPATGSAPSVSSAGSSAKPYGGGPTSASGGSVSAKKSINSSLMVTMTSANNNNNNLTKQASNASGNSSALKPLSLPNSTTVYPMTITANSITLPSSTGVSMHPGLPANNQITNPSLLALSQASAALVAAAATATTAPPSMSMSTGHHNVQMTLNSSNSNNSLSAPAVSSPALINPLDQLLQGGCSSLVSQAQLQAFVHAYSNAGLGAASGMTNENSAAQLLSKIPKSLTVIPQQKQRSMSRVSSNEDQNSA